MEVLIQQINDLVSEIQNDTNRTKLPLLSEKLIQLSKLYGESKREMNELIDQIDAFISKDSFLITDKEMDQAMENWNRLFDISNSEQEANEIDQLKHNNLRASH
jgi:predicted patatin/cPLA2 family phospholipase